MHIYIFQLFMKQSTSSFARGKHYTGYTLNALHDVSLYHISVQCVQLHFQIGENCGIVLGVGKCCFAPHRFLGQPCIIVQYSWCVATGSLGSSLECKKKYLYNKIYYFLVRILYSVFYNKPTTQQKLWLFILFFCTYVKKQPSVWLSPYNDWINHVSKVS